MEWNEETIARLQTLWAEGHSTAEIGRRMIISKNAVVGKAHRLNLQARPSPIRREAGGSVARPAPVRRLIGPTLPPLVASTPASTPAPVPAVLAAVVTKPASPAPRPAPVSVRPAPYRPTRLSTCCWPIGEPGTKSFRFCDADSNVGKPYCSEHAALAYVKVRDRRDEAAA
jgi:GcrA cell cycle regulator